MPEQAAEQDDSLNRKLRAVAKTKSNCNLSNLVGQGGGWSHAERAGKVKFTSENSKLGNHVRDADKMLTAIIIVDRKSNGLLTSDDVNFGVAPCDTAADNLAASWSVTWRPQIL